VIACMGDAARIAAYAGVSLGKKFLAKFTMRAIQTLTGALLLLIALGLSSGLILSADRKSHFYGRYPGPVPSVKNTSQLQNILSGKIPLIS